MEEAQPSKEIEEMEKASSCKREPTGIEQTEALRPSSKSQGHKPTESRMGMSGKME
jgi:hypothetical protein